MFKLPNHKVFNIISDISEEENLQVYIIGGFVRDLILKRPSKDIDIVVLGSGIDLAKKTASKLKNKTRVSIFKRFGTAMFKSEGIEFEFVGARKESYSHDSRKPSVEDGTLSDDQNRRDFTINALAISLNKKDFGQLTDPFNGLEHIKNKMIKTPLEPDITFSDDPLRMMRAIRFATQLDFNINPATFRSIKQNKDRISILSKERITDELNKILLTKKPSVGFKLLDKAELLEIIFPEIHALKGIETINGIGHKDNFLHTLQVVDNIAKVSNNLWLRWAALLHDVAKPNTKRFTSDGWTFHSHEFIGAKMVPDIFKRMRLPLNEKLNYVSKLVKLHLRPIPLVKSGVTDSAIRRLLFEAGDDINDLMTLSEADITSKQEKKVKQYLENFKIVRQKLIEVEKKDKIRNWQPPISGEIIIEAFNIKPSREVGLIKDAIKDAILDGVISNDYKNAFEFMLKEGQKLGLTIKKK